MEYIIYRDYFLTETLKKKKQSKKLKFIKLNYKKINVFFKVIRKIHFILPIPKKEIWLDTQEFYKEINKKQVEDKIIFFDLCDEATLEVAKKLDKSYLWIWNKIENTPFKIKKLKKVYKKIFTFDNEDAKRYSLNYRPQFYWENGEDEILKIDYDLFFIGLDKERIKILYLLDKYTKLNNKFLVIRDKGKFYKKKYKYLLADKKDYEETKEIICKSRCLVEINKRKQVGLTMRSLEALFYKKKLITNNKMIKNYDFYDENNIFILEDAEIANSHIETKIKEFLKKEMKEIDKQILKKYTFEMWLKSIE